MVVAMDEKDQVNAELKRELQDWRELVEAVCELPLPPEQRKKKLWPNKWHQDCAMVAFALHGSEETAAELVLAHRALEDIGTLAHCIAKAGPANTPTLEDAWSKFNLISVKATGALAPGRRR